MNFNEALSAAQLEIGKIEKDKENPFFNSSYVSLDKLLTVVKPILSSQGLLLTSTVSTDPLVLSTMITSIAGEGGRLSEVPLLISGNNQMQSLGSAITYASRYSIMSLLAISLDGDDDGNSTVDNTKETKSDNYKDGGYSYA